MCSDCNWKREADIFQVHYGFIFLVLKIINYNVYWVIYTRYYTLPKDQRRKKSYKVHDWNSDSTINRTLWHKCFERDGIKIKRREIKRFCFKTYKIRLSSKWYAGELWIEVLDLWCIQNCMEKHNMGWKVWKSTLLLITYILMCQISLNQQHKN